MFVAARCVAPEALQTLPGELRIPDALPATGYGSTPDGTYGSSKDTVTVVPNGSCATVTTHAGPQCVPVDEWVYDRGPGNFNATAMFSNGVLVRVDHWR